MTDEELLNARADEAVRRWHTAPNPLRSRDLTLKMAEVIAENWQPVDPDLIEAREIAAKVYERVGRPAWAQMVRTGSDDEGIEGRCAIAGIKRGRELERQREGG